MMTTTAALLGTLPVAIGFGWRRFAATLGSRRRRRTDRVASLDAFYDARDIPLYGPAQRVDWQAKRQRTRSAENRSTRPTYDRQGGLKQLIDAREPASGRALLLLSSGCAAQYFLRAPWPRSGTFSKRRRKRTIDLGLIHSIISTPPHEHGHLPRQ